MESDESAPHHFFVSEEGSLFGQCEGCSWPGAQWVALRFAEHLSISCEKLRSLRSEVKTQVLSVGPWLWAAVRLAWAFVVWQASWTRPDLTGKEAVVEISIYSLGWEGTGFKSRYKDADEEERG